VRGPNLSAVSKGADGQETQSGTVRGDSARVSVWGGNKPRHGKEVENAPAACSSLAPPNSISQPMAVM
jgi:hypothetical protein